MDAKRTCRSEIGVSAARTVAEGSLVDTRWAKIPIGLALRHELSARDWRVLIVVAAHANERGENAYPSIGTISARVGIDKADASRCLTHAKQLRGTLRKSRANPREADLPLPPACLAAELHSRFGEVARELYEAGLMSRLDATPIALFMIAEETVHLCDHHWRRARKMAALDALVVTGGVDGVIKRSPLLIARDAAVKEMARSAAELGLTPSSRQRIDAHPPGTDADDPAAKFFTEKWRGGNVVPIGKKAVPEPDLRQGSARSLPKFRPWAAIPASRPCKTLKSELVWQTVFYTRQEADHAIGRYIDGFYNPVRRHSALHFTSPAQFEKTAPE